MENDSVCFVVNFTLCARVFLHCIAAVTAYNLTYNSVVLFVYDMEMPRSEKLDYDLNLFFFSFMQIN